MKQWKRIIIFSILLVVMIGALIFASLYKNKDGGENNVTPTPTIDPIVSIAEKDITQVTLVNKSGTLVFTPSAIKTENSIETLDWSISSPQNPKYDKEVIGYKIALYTQIDAESVITTPSANLADYGLDKPVATLSIVLRPGEKKKILYGNEVANTSSRYVTVEGSGRICVANRSYSDAVMLRMMDFLNVKVMNGIELKDTRTLHFKRIKDRTDFTATSDKNGSKDGQTPASWSINTPIVTPASGDSFNTFLTQLVSIVATSYVELAPKDLAKYGLDVPSYDITLATETKKVHIILGKAAGDGLLYGYTEDMNAVFIISSGGLTSIDKPFLELSSSFIIVPPNIWDVKAIDIKIDGLSIHCDVNDSKEDTTKSDFKVNGVNANVKTSSDKSYFRQFYQSIIGIRIDELDLAAKPAYDPAITIDYTKNDNNTIKIAFIKRDEITYYVFKDGVYLGFYVFKDSFYSEKKSYEGVLPSYRILEDAMKNQVNGVYQ